MALYRLNGPGNEATINNVALGLERMVSEHPGVEYRILDVGGAECPLRCATHVADLMPYDKRRVDHYRGTVEEQFTRSSWLPMDVCDTPWDWPNDFFDYVWCCQVVEDIRDPIGVCREMMRVGQAGFISTVHRSYESTVVQADGVVGYHHHRWLVEVVNDVLTFTWKSPILHVNPAMRPAHSTDWLLHIGWHRDFEVAEQFVGGDSGQRLELTQYLTDRWTREVKK